MRRIVAALVLAAATIGGTALAVGTANADISGFLDGFDDNPESRWSMTRTSPGGLVTFGSSRATISANQSTGFTAVGRTFRVPAEGRHECAVGIALRTTGVAAVQVNIEVIDPATFNYIALKEVTVTGAEFRKHSVGWSNGPLKDVQFRVSLLAANASRSVSVDSLAVACDHEDL